MPAGTGLRGTGWEGRHLNPVECSGADPPHLAINAVTVLPSELNSKTNNCVENVPLKYVGISGCSFGVLEICTTELCFSLHERKNISQ